MTPADKFDRTIPIEAWVNKRHTTIRFVVHLDQIAIVAPGVLIEIHVSVWRLLSMRVATRHGALVRYLRRRHE